MAEKKCVVTVIQKDLKHYRIPLHNQLRNRLGNVGIEYRFVYGQHSSKEVEKQDGGELTWAHKVKNIECKIGKSNLIYQPVLRHVLKSDIVIVEHAGSLVINYIIMMLNYIYFVRPKVCLWGHGRNFQADVKKGLDWRLKKWMANAAHFWFAYNMKSVVEIQRLGVAEQKIQNVENSVDTTAISNVVRSLSLADMASIKSEYGIQGGNVCVFIGSIYLEKKPEYLIEAALQIKEMVPDFELLVIGAGPLEGVIMNASRGYPWIKYLGPVTGDRKARLLAISKLILMPGLVGLAVLDSFASLTPCVTTDYQYHSPEIEYLVPGVNGVKLPAEVTSFQYASKVAEILNDTVEYTKLVQGCKGSQELYSIEKMAENFVAGIQKAILLRVSG